MVGNWMKYAVYLVFGIGTWFIYSSAKDIIMEKGWTSTETLFMGFAIVGLVFLTYRFKLHNLVLR